jgi:hypothetical protein
MTQCYQTVLNTLALDSSSQDNGGDVAYLLLSALAAEETALTAALAAQSPPASPSADTYPNAFQEVLYRLSAYDGYTYRRLSELLHDCCDF